MERVEKLGKVSRVTVVGNQGRILEMVNLKNVELHLQDDGKTLKVFFNETAIPAPDETTEYGR